MIGYCIAVLVLAGCLWYIRRYKKRFSVEPETLENQGIWYEKIIRAIPDIIFIFDRSFRVIKIYNAGEKELFVTPDKLLRKDVRNYVPAGLAVLIEKGVEKALLEDEPYEIEYEAGEGPSLRYYEARFLHIFGGQVACFVRDITGRKKSEVALKQNEELMRVVLDTMPMPVMLKDIDRDFAYIYWNRECEEQAGFDRTHTLGKTDFDIYGPKRGAYLREVDRKVLQQRESYRKQEVFVTPDGQEHVTIVTKNVIENDFHRWMLVTRWDITDLIRAQQALKEMNSLNRLILNNTNTGLVFLTPDYKVEWENLSSYNSNLLQVGYRKGYHCYETVRNRQSPCEDCVVPKAMASRKIESTEKYFENGTVLNVMAVPVKGEQEELKGIVVKVEDITVQKKAEEELKRAKEEAEKSDRLKSAFIANMSHEIRTPLNAILGFCELLIGTENPEEKGDYVTVIKNNCDQLLHLVNDILDLSKIEAGSSEFVYAETDLRPLLEELGRRFSYKIESRKELKIVFEPGLPGCVVYTDAERVLQVMSNFLVNAVKFTEKGQITFGYKQVEEGVYFYVKDTGIGIAADKQKKIFARFVKLDSFKTGTGLGLAICQVIVKKLKGKIGVDSVPGCGSNFWFILPSKVLRLPASGQEERQAAGNVAGKKTEIPAEKPVLLIAEDVADNYKLYEVFLSGKYRLLHAWNGKEAVELFRLHQPDAILMDIKMPGMNGYEATAEIRRMSSYIPIIAVTAFAFAEDKKRILESGFTDYVTKPITANSLAKVLRTIGN